MSSTTEPGFFDATTLFGAIQSDVPMQTNSWGNSQHARSPNGSSTQKIALHSTFNVVYLHQEIVPPVAGPAVVNSTEPIKNDLTMTLPAPAGSALVIEGMIGDVRVEGTDEAQATAIATRYVRMKTIDNAAKALEGLVAKFEAEGPTLHLRTQTQGNLEELGCASYRVDLLIRAPRTLPVRVVGESGRTSVVGTTAAVVVEQSKGLVTIEHSQGNLDLSNRFGDVSVVDAAGPAAVSCSSGNVTLRGVGGAIEVSCTEGRTIIDSPRAGVTVRNKGGDVRIIALEGIGGDYEVTAEDGSVSIVIPPTSNATVLMTSNEGRVYSAVPVTGTMTPDLHNFTGRLNNADTHLVRLTTHRGNIILD